MKSLSKNTVAVAKADLSVELQRLDVASPLYHPYSTAGCDVIIVSSLLNGECDVRIVSSLLNGRM